MALITVLFVFVFVSIFVYVLSFGECVKNIQRCVYVCVFFFGGGG